MSLTNPFDIGIIIIFGFCLVRGFFRGFVKEVISLIGVLAGFYAACVYYLDIAHLLSKWISHPPYLNILSFLIILIGVFVLVSLSGAAIKYLMDIAFLGWIDRFLGVVTGSIKGMIIVSIVLVSFLTFSKFAAMTARGLSGRPFRCRSRAMALVSCALTAR